VQPEPEQREQKEPQEQLVFRALQAHRDPQELKGLLELREQQDRKEAQDRKALLEQDLLEL
jgi:hypothetical protein